MIYTNVGCHSSCMCRKSGSKSFQYKLLQFRRPLTSRTVHSESKISSILSTLPKVKWYRTQRLRNMLWYNLRDLLNHTLDVYLPNTCECSPSQFLQSCSGQCYRTNNPALRIFCFTRTNFTFISFLHIIYKPVICNCRFCLSSL